jgi:ADP-ribose pyrophosphatase YjhB (NUDIX family)
MDVSQVKDSSTWSAVRTKKLIQDATQPPTTSNKVSVGNRGACLIPYDNRITHRCYTIPRVPLTTNKAIAPITNVRRLVLDTPFASKSTVSYGLIVYAKNSKRWLLTQRKHSIEYLLFFRGLYRLSHLPLILSRITVTERDTIKLCLTSDPGMFGNIYLYDLHLSSEDLHYALLRWVENRTHTSNLLDKLDVSNNTLAWTWPKGRLNINAEREAPFECAHREFLEEVEAKLPEPIFISDTYMSETIHTVTGRSIEARYWIYVIEKEITLTPPNNHMEVSDRRWLTTEQCQELIQYDDLFRYVVEVVNKIS